MQSERLTAEVLTLEPAGDVKHFLLPPSEKYQQVEESIIANSHLDNWEPNLDYQNKIKQGTEKFPLQNEGKQFKTCEHTKKYHETLLDRASSPGRCRVVVEAKENAWHLNIN